MSIFLPILDEERLFVYIHGAGYIPVSVQFPVCIRTDASWYLYGCRFISVRIRTNSRTDADLLQRVRAFFVIVRCVRTVVFRSFRARSAFRQLIHPCEGGFLEFCLECLVCLEVEVDALDVACRYFLFGIRSCAADGDAETAPVAQLHALAAEQAAQQHLAELSYRHHRFAGVQGGFFRQVHRHLGFVHLCGSYLGDIPF